jgi:hypothetical protein
MLILAVSDVLFAVVVITVGVVGFAAGIVLALRSGKDYAQIGSTGRYGVFKGRPDSPRHPVSQQAPEDRAPE